MVHDIGNGGRPGGAAGCRSRPGPDRFLETATTPVRVYSVRGEFAKKLDGAVMPTGKGWKAVTDREKRLQLMIRRLEGLHGSHGRLPGPRIAAGPRERPPGRPVGGDVGAARCRPAGGAAVVRRELRR